MTSNSFPGRMTIAVKALTALEQLGRQPKLITRANNLLTKILGDDAGYAIQEGDGENIVFLLDDMRFIFICGGTPDDDFFQVSFLGAPSGLIPVRSITGLGYAIAVNLTTIRSIFSCMARNSESQER